MWQESNNSQINDQLYFLSKFSYHPYVPHSSADTFDAYLPYFMDFTRFIQDYNLD